MQAHDTPATLEPDALYTRREVAAFLKVSERTVTRSACLRATARWVGARRRWLGRDVLRCLDLEPAA